MISWIKKIIDYVFGKKLGGETIRYLIVGVMTTLINFGLFELMHEIMDIDVTVSNVTSISVSIIFAYFANKLVVFRYRSETTAALVLEFLKFVGSRLFTMALEVGLVALFYYILGQDAWLGKAVSQVLVIIANYIISKALVFRSKREKGEE